MRRICLLRLKAPREILHMQSRPTFEFLHMQSRPIIMQFRPISAVHSCSAFNFWSHQQPPRAIQQTAHPADVRGRIQGDQHQFSCRRVKFYVVASNFHVAASKFNLVPSNFNVVLGRNNYARAYFPDVFTRSKILNSWKFHAFSEIIFDQKPPRARDLDQNYAQVRAEGSFKASWLTSDPHFYWVCRRIWSEIERNPGQRIDSERKVTGKVSLMALNIDQIMN